MIGDADYVCHEGEECRLIEIGICYWRQQFWEALSEYRKTVDSNGSMDTVASVTRFPNEVFEFPGVIEILSFVLEAIALWRPVRVLPISWDADH